MLCFPTLSPTRRQSQRRDLSRIMLSHAPRQLPAWLIFDVGPFFDASSCGISASACRSFFSLASSARLRIRAPSAFRFLAQPFQFGASTFSRSRTFDSQAASSLNPSLAHSFSIRSVVIHPRRAFPPSVQQDARANAVTCHGSCCACSAPVHVVAHL